MQASCTTFVGTLFPLLYSAVDTDAGCLLQVADVQAQASRVIQSRPVSAVMPLQAAPVPFRPAAVPFGQAAVPFKPVTAPPQAAAQLFRPAAVPFRTSTTLPEPAQLSSDVAAGPHSARMGFKPAQSPVKPAEEMLLSAAVTSKLPVRPTQSAAVVMPVKASSELAVVPSKAAQLSSDSASVPAEAAKVPLKPAPVPTEAAKTPPAAAPITGQSKQVTPVSSLRQPRQQSVILQTDQTAASSVSVTTVREDTGAAGTPAAENAQGTPDPLLPATAAAARAPKSGSAVTPSATRIIATAGLPDDSPGARAEAPSKTPAQKADAPVAHPAATLTVSKADLPSKPKAGTPTSPSPLKADLPVTPPAAKAASQASLKADAIRAANQPNRPTQTILAQDESAPHEPADKVLQSSTVGAADACSESADRGSAEQPSQEGSQSADRQERFPRARRPIVSAVKANLVALEPATRQVCQCLSSLY